jgi:hypothetical protein
MHGASLHADCGIPSRRFTNRTLTNTPGPEHQRIKQRTELDASAKPTQSLTTMHHDHLGGMRVLAQMAYKAAFEMRNCTK